MKFPQIGEVLSNGYTVDAAYCIGEDRYALTHKDGVPEPYVVCYVNQDGDTCNERDYIDLTSAQSYFAFLCSGWIISENDTEELLERRQKEQERFQLTIDEIQHLKELLKQSMDDDYRGRAESRERSHVANHVLETVYAAIITSDKTRISLNARLALLENLLYSEELRANRLESAHKTAMEEARHKFAQEVEKQVRKKI